MHKLMMLIICSEATGSFTMMQNLVTFIGITFMIIISTNYPSRKFEIGTIKLIQRVWTLKKRVKELKQKLGE